MQKLCFIKYQEINLNLNRDLNSDLQISSLVLCHWAILALKVECQARDLEVQVRVPVQVQIFLLKFSNVNVQGHKL